MFNLLKKSTVESVQQKNNLDTLRTMLREFEIENAFTPDMKSIMHKEFQLFFIPDELKMDNPLYSLYNEASVSLGPAYTKSSYQFYVKNLEAESFGIVLKDAHPNRKVPIINRKPGLREPDFAKIRGELHAIRPYQINKLDQQKLNGVHFKRERVDIVFPYFEEYTQIDRDDNRRRTFLTGEQVYILRAWMYIGVEDYWRPQLDAGYLFQPVQQFRSTKKWIKVPYYEYTCPK